MRVTDFSFELPESLIAHYPMPERSSCRLLSLDGPTGALTHGTFTDLLDKLNPGDLLVFNNTRVIPARLFGRKASGGKIEVLVERMLDDKRILAHIRASKAPKPGAELLLGDDESINATMTARHGALFEVEFNDERSVLDILNSIGHMPLPPYITHKLQDKNRYQTVYAKHEGSAAAPTAGLHFTKELLQQVQDAGVKIAHVTLHVGLGTFRPVKVEDVTQHHMHSEFYVVEEDQAKLINDTKAAGGRVIAVGTTSCRTLESATGEDGILKAGSGWTEIFIYPGYRFKMIDGLITNFHLPESTLVMLVSALAGKEHIMAAYEEAVREKYRFFSFGDAMMIE
mgnify:CR=1 FL=1